MTETYRGLLVETSNGEEDSLLGLRAGEHEDILAETLRDDMERHGRYLSVRYFISDREMDAGELLEELVKVATGLGEIKYGMAYSEITGYLWTNEQIQVGGHDLLEELGHHLGKYLHLEVTYSPAGRDS